MTAIDFLFENDLKALESHFKTLVEKTVFISQEHKAKRNITDWPFEYFWTNPKEPIHSKLLGYFINPAEDHKCGKFLLKKFLHAIAPDCAFISDDVKVHVEVDHIDLVIERIANPGRYVIIIENKINGAVNQEKQLERYVNLKGLDFDPPEIYVFYLPFFNDKNPDRADQQAIEEKGVHYQRITYAKHITNWLNEVLSLEYKPEWPEGMQNGMSENLTHYRSLINFLNKQQHEQKMNTQLLAKLADSESKKQLPTLNDLETISTSIEALKKCLKVSLFGKLLLRMQQHLQQNGAADLWFCNEGNPTEKVIISSPYDIGLDQPLSLCVNVTDNVSVCFGGGPYGLFWFGYLKNGITDVSETDVLEEAGKYLKDIDPTHPWFGYGFESSDYALEYDENAAVRLADKLLEMRISLSAKLGVDPQLLH